jgi:cytochrome c-type biogenesis protein CcmH
MRPLRLALLALVIAAPALAVQPSEMLKDPAQEARARELSAQLRCLVCQNESIDDSDADLAKDIRLLIRERITKGESNAEVRDFLVSRYGDFILLKPPFKLSTALLWFSAPLTFLLGGLAIWFASRRRPAPTAALSEKEERLLLMLQEAGAVVPPTSPPPASRRRSPSSRR